MADGAPLEPIAVSSGPVSSGAAESGAWPFVWGLWALLAAVALAYVARFGPDIPLWDDFDAVDVIAGSRRLSVEWLWSLHNEHRVPLPRLVLLALYKLSGTDFRAGMFFNVAALTALAGAAIAVAGRLRGGTRTCDAVLPLALLSAANHENILWSWQLVFVLSTALAGAVLLVIVSRGDWPGPRNAALVGLGVAALPLCGANALVLVPALVCWLLAGAGASWSAGTTQRRLAASIALALCGLALLIVTLYLLDFRHAGHHVAAESIGMAARTSLQFLALMFGPPASDLWPASGVVALLVVASSAALAARAAFTGSPVERPRALGLVAAFAAFGSLVLALGWGRAGSGENVGFGARYSTLIAPLWIVVFFTWELYASSAIARVMLTSVFSALLLFFWPNAVLALEYGRKAANQASSFERDVRAGMPSYLLVKRYTPFFHPSQDEAGRMLEVLRNARIGLFKTLRPDPSFREVRVPTAPSDLKFARWENGTALVTGIDPYLHFVLPRALSVAEIRLKYSHANRVGGAGHFRFSWTSAAGLKPEAAQRSSNWALPTGKDRVTIIRVADTVKEFWIQPDNQPCEFSIEEIVLRIPPG
jgi:hypothetical protein